MASIIRTEDMIEKINHSQLLYFKYGYKKSEPFQTRFRWRFILLSI